MKLNKLKEFNEALANLSDEVKNMRLDMESIEQQSWDTPFAFCNFIGFNGFVGIISMVSMDLPELRNIYQERSGDNIYYNYYMWTEAFSIFLGFDRRRDLIEWADKNHKLWGCSKGFEMFQCDSSYLPDTDSFKGINLTHRDLIAWWAQVEKNITKQSIDECFEIKR